MPSQLAAEVANPPTLVKAVGLVIATVDIESHKARSSHYGLGIILADQAGCLGMKGSEIIGINPLAIRFLAQFKAVHRNLGTSGIRRERRSVLRSVVEHGNREHHRQSPGDSASGDPIDARLFGLGITITRPVPRIGRGDVTEGLFLVGAVNHMVVEIKLPGLPRHDLTDRVAHGIAGIVGTFESRSRTTRHPDPQIACLNGFAEFQKLLSTLPPMHTTFGKLMPNRGEEVPRMAAVIGAPPCRILDTEIRRIRFAPENVHRVDRYRLPEIEDHPLGVTMIRFAGIGMSEVGIALPKALGITIH